MSAIYDSLVPTEAGCQVHKIRTSDLESTY